MAPASIQQVTPSRVDVLSVKGGVGKTTIAYSLAHAQATYSKRPVLLIDADLTGTCVGDLLDPLVSWHRQRNLAHLLCDPPDTLPEAVGPDHLPVYRVSDVTTSRDARRASGADGPGVVFCPSHAYSSAPSTVDRAVLEALIGQETAGAWVRYVLDRLIEATAEALGPLGGVVVDHGPGLATLQAAILGDVAKAPTGRTVALVTSCDRVDLAMCKSLSASHFDELRSARWLVNRAPTDWDPSAYETTDPALVATWHATAHRIPHDDTVRDAYRRSALTTAPLALEPLRAQVFGA